jgi:hypothetical protein
MAIQTRYVGDSLPITNVDLGASYGNPSSGAIIATGLTKAPIALAITTTGTGATGNLALEMVTGGAVESILRQLEIDGTVTMYQVGGGSNYTQLSVLLEASGAGPANSGYGAQTYSPSTIATAIQTRLQAMLGNVGTAGGNIGIASNVWAASTTVTSVGFKLATS